MGKNHEVKLKALIDCGASTLFISKRVADRKHLPRRNLPEPIHLKNVDLTTNKIGEITQEVELDLRINNHTTREKFLIADIGKDEVIIGIDWLKKHNPEINWVAEKIQFSRCPENCGRKTVGHRKRTIKIAKVESTEGGVTLPRNWEIPPNPEYDINSGNEPEENDEIYELVDEELGLQIAVSTTISQRIKESTERKEGEKTFEELVPKQYHFFKDVFSKKASERMPVRKPYDHEIKLEPGRTLPYAKAYPMAPPEQEALAEYLEENLKKGYIRPSKSHTAAPVFFIKKKDGTLRLVVDYQRLNSITIKDRYPLPLTQSLLDRFAKAKVFTTLDLRWGYNNIRIKEGDEEKAAFVTNQGLFEPLVMGFGLCNAPATFQRMMNDIFKDLLNVYMVVYLDDILIFSSDEKQHEQHVKEILRRLRKNDLFCKPEKCYFFQKKVDYLGFVISHNRIEMDQGKVKAIVDWPEPTKVKEVQSFLGFANFYRRFIDGYSRMVRPITRLLRKGMKWGWGELQKLAFLKLKGSFTTAPVLIMPNPEKQYIIECDASDFATGAVLSQKDNQGKTKPIAFRSSGMSPAERNYEIYDKELLAIIRALEDWRHYLEGATEPVLILTDHQNLQYFATARTLTRRQARWSLFLTRFNYEIRHRPGRLGGKPDKLSRRADYELKEKDNQGSILIDPKKFRVAAMKRGHLSVADDHPLLKRIRQSQNLDKEVSQAMQAIQDKGTRKLLKGVEDWNRENGLILFRGKVYVPNDPDIRRELVKLHHDSLEAGHPGEYKTLELVTRNYWWPRITAYIKDYVRSCDTCNRKKTSTRPSPGALQPITPAEIPWTTVTNDFIVELPESNGYDAIWVVADQLTKEAHFVPVNSNIDTEETIDLYMNHVWRHHGLPKKMISDRGTQFTSKLMQGLFKKLKIEGAYSTAYHPQTDGQTERINQELEQYLRNYCSYRQDDWSTFLPMAEFAYNNHEHATTKKTPFYAARGYHPRTMVIHDLDSHAPHAEEIGKRMKKIHDEIHSAIITAQETMKYYYDKKHGDTPEYQVGDKVWLDGKNLKTTAPSKKLADKKLGPFPVEAKVSELNYRLTLPMTIPVHPVFHVSRLYPFQEDVIPGRTLPPPPPVEIEGEEEHEVDEIIDGRLWRNQKQYLIKWKGYTNEHNTWQRLADLEHAPEAVAAFHKKHPKFTWKRPNKRSASKISSES